MYPESEFPSYEGLPKINSLRDILDSLDLSKEYERGKHTAGMKEEKLQCLFDKLFVLVENT